MERMFVVRSASCSRDRTPSSWSTVKGLGFSVARFVLSSRGPSPGIRVDLVIEDQSTLTELAVCYANELDLHWTLGFGSETTPVTIPLRFKRFDRLSGHVQLARTLVPGSVHGNVDFENAPRGDGAAGAPPSSRSSDTPSESDAVNRQPPESTSDSEPLSSLWPKIFD